MNKLKEEKKEKKAKGAGSKVARGFLQVLDGTFLTKENFMQLLPFVFFLTGLAIVYIANSYYSERTIRDIQNINTELKELRSEFITTKSELMFRSKQSEVANSVADLGIEESRMPPKKIIIKKGVLDKN